MVTAGFVAPYLLDTTTRFVEAAAGLPDTRLALITTEPADRLPPELKQHLAGHWRTRRLSSKPSMRGICKSVIRMSGRLAWIASQASWPSEAVETS